MFDGRINGVLQGDEATEQNVGILMAGGSLEPEKVEVS
jgi:hypothetical protein